MVKVAEITSHFCRSKWRHWYKVEFHPVYAWVCCFNSTVP